jgi:hypothetical protein
VEIERILHKHGIPHVEGQVRISECRDQHPLVFDFRINKRAFIEYQGEQHFLSVKQWGGEDGLQDRKKKDEIKRQYCEDRGYPLLLISHSQFDSIEERIVNFVNKHNLLARGAVV